MAGTQLIQIKSCLTLCRSDNGEDEDGDKQFQQAAHRERELTSLSSFCTIITDTNAL